MVYRTVVIALLSAVGLSAINGTPSEAPLVVPVKFHGSIDASKARLNDLVIANTVEVSSMDGHEVRKGTRVIGHVVAARGFMFDSSPNATQAPSFLSIRFDKLIIGEASIPLTAWVRALAHPADSRQAQTVQHFDEHDTVGTITQVGGDTYRPGSEPVFSIHGDIVGYSRRAGVFARLLPGEYVNPYSHLTCDGFPVEEPVAIFSANACGLYGFDSVYMVDNGRGAETGTFRLESRQHTVKLYAGSTALLQTVNGLEPGTR